MNLLDAINDPAELRRLPRSRLAPLARQLRQYLLDSVSRTCGRLSSNLGSVELTIALHYVFDTQPSCWLPWDWTPAASPLRSGSGSASRNRGLWLTPLRPTEAN